MRVESLEMEAPECVGQPLWFLLLGFTNDGGIVEDVGPLKRIKKIEPARQHAVS